MRRRGRWQQKRMTRANRYSPGGQNGPVTITRADGTTEVRPADPRHQVVDSHGTTSAERAATRAKQGRRKRT